MTAPSAIGSENGNADLDDVRAGVLEALEQLDACARRPGWPAVTYGTSARRPRAAQRRRSAARSRQTK